MHVGLLTIHLKFYGCNSLKEKRSLLRPFEHQLSKQFNISIAETGFQDNHSDSEMTIGLVNNNPAYIEAEFSRIQSWIESYFPDLLIFEQKVEIM